MLLYCFLDSIPFQIHIYRINHIGNISCNELNNDHSNICEKGTGGFIHGDRNLFNELLQIIYFLPR